MPKVLEALFGTRCQPAIGYSREDNRELDVLEFWKYVCMFMCQINATAFFELSASIANPWQILDFFKVLSIAIVISAQIAVEAFHFFSTFICAYQCFKHLRETGKRYLSVKDILRIYLRKYLRLAPMYYFVLLAGWSTCPYISDEPQWALLKNMWYDCDSRWFYKLLFVGNL